MLISRKKPLTLSLLFLCGMFTFISCLDNSSNSGTTENNLNLAERIDTFEELETFSDLLSEVDLDSTALNDSIPHTVFAPTNNAFDELPDGVLDTLSNESLHEVLSYHIAEGVFFLSDFDEGTDLETLQGDDLLISVQSRDSVDVNDGILVSANIRAYNGIIHATNAVLFPDNYLNVAGIVAKRYNLTTLEAALDNVNLTGTLEENTDQGYTVFAPSEDALEGVDLPDDQQELTDILEYHIIPQHITSEDINGSQTFETLSGNELTVELSGVNMIINEETTVTTADLEGTNGVVHITGSLLESSSD